MALKKSCFHRFFCVADIFSVWQRLMFKYSVFFSFLLFVFHGFPEYIIGCAILHLNIEGDRDDKGNSVVFCQ